MSKYKFVDLRKSLETNKNKHETVILRCWESLPGKFTCLKKVITALLSAFEFTYFCEKYFHA